MLYQVMMVVGCIILASGEVAARGVSLQGRIEDAASGVSLPLASVQVVRPDEARRTWLRSSVARRSGAPRIQSWQSEAHTRMTIKKE